MTLTSKFNIGDTVYVLEEGGILKCVVRHILFPEVTRFLNAVSEDTIKYGLMPEKEYTTYKKCGISEGHNDYFYKYQRSVFSNVKELCEALYEASKNL